MNLGPFELIVILAVVLLFFGPKRLPGLAQSLGESVRGFKKALSGEEENTRDVTHSVANEQLKAPTSAEAKQTQSQSEKEKV